MARRRPDVTPAAERCAFPVLHRFEYSALGLQETSKIANVSVCLRLAVAPEPVAFPLERESCLMLLLLEALLLLASGLDSLLEVLV
jgi:hypothetical protein